MVNFRFNLGKVYQKGFGKKAEELKKQGKKIPKFYFHPKETAIYISCSVQGYVKTNTGLTIKPESFDVASQLVKTRDNKSIQLQRTLNSIKDQCAIDYMEAKRIGGSISKSEVKAIMERAVGGETAHEANLSTFEVYEIFYNWKKDRIASKTLYRYSSLKDNLILFQKKRKKTISIHELDERFGDEFSLFLIKEKNYAHNTVVKYLKLLKAFGGYCFDYEYSVNVKFKRIKALEHKSSVFVLSEEEVKKIAELVIENMAHNEVREAFLMMIYTGVRYSDIIQFSWSDIVYGDKFSFWNLFEFKTKKTVATKIPLLPQAIEILDKRSGDKKGNLVFKLPTNQTMNSILKVIAKNAGIEGQFTIVRRQGHNVIKIQKERWECVSSHTGRKTFVTTSLSKGMSADLVRLISGHQDAKSMIPYINISDENVANQLLRTYSKKQKNGN